MKKNIIKIAFVAMTAFTVPATMNAQLNEILGKVIGSSNAANTVTNVLGDLIGSGKITADKLAGTWTYTEPCVAFESENVLGNLGGSAVSSKIEEKLNKGLTKAGIKPGKVTLTFNADNTFSMTVGKKTLTGTFAINESDVTLNFNTPAKSIKTNAKISLNTLQLAMNADKMFEIVNTIATKASAYSSQMSTISAVLSNYKGMYLGMKFSKK